MSGNKSGRYKTYREMKTIKELAQSRREKLQRETTPVLNKFDNFIKKLEKKRDGLR
ncbi:hypothetical protein ACFWAE_21100 [Priestia megaterium]|uniref:hypothetical protein n=1 Tax=Priestia megaterium TaxID=1404 RepID=UPI00366DEDFB